MCSAAGESIEELLALPHAPLADVCPLFFYVSHSSPDGFHPQPRPRTIYKTGM
ncbi:hypothetical protein ACU4GD_19850 [Cupriavidus basilensis]